MTDRRILLVEDEPGLVMTLCDRLRSEGYQVESVDYRGMETVKARSDRLIEVCKTLSGDLVLVGSSLGGYVAVAASSLLHARGAFLMAPALYVEGLPPLRERKTPSSAPMISRLGSLGAIASALAWLGIEVL